VHVHVDEPGDHESSREVDDADAVRRPHERRRSDHRDHTVVDEDRLVRGGRCTGAVDDSTSGESEPIVGERHAYNVRTAAITTRLGSHSRERRS